ncbi:uncharacterized protein C11orf71 homolog [Oryctolagus cuniculus]|uniref:Chromosome 11 open reading frame 71 n=1 Tax=Oryctolagus cuniculus TaxID=9986 RepID=G1SJH7_RABIT|nr:uncharacterized protein C11orf71 homolog [Oryctolagus cuniculus]
MALNCVSLSAGDQRNRAAYRALPGDRSPSASAWAMVSGDGFLVARPGAVRPGPRQAVRPNIRESRRVTASGRSPPSLINGRDPDARSRGHQTRFSPYPPRGVKLDLLRSVLQQRLVALGAVLASRIAA